jgi:hypothetical protein
MYTSIGMIELNITRAQAAQGSHSGVCDEDISALRTVPAIRRQLARVDPAVLKRELADHDANLSRLLWLACGDINDRP